jgi:2-C-methyl-D-erythritol 4-phosphate cytidylyltransferase
MSLSEHCWAVVPAAGVGARMGGAVPKQYLALEGQMVLQRTVRTLGAHSRITGVVIAVSETDPWFESAMSPLGDVDWCRAAGGSQRCDSVLNALTALAERAGLDDWVLVHDAARPCLRADDIDALLEQIPELRGRGAGAILGTPVADTMKRVDANGRVVETVSRDGLMRALTPQMFRLGELRDAIEEAIRAGVKVTDEASAMEHAGYQPLVVTGHADNIKITRPEDLELAAMTLRAIGT